MVVVTKHNPDEKFQIDNFLLEASHKPNPNKSLVHLIAWNSQTISLAVGLVNSRYFNCVRRDMCMYVIIRSLMDKCGTEVEVNTNNHDHNIYAHHNIHTVKKFNFNFI